MALIGKYEILETLGTGSMGTVSRARDTVLDRMVALKTIRTGPSVEPELRERFYREARACARLQHPNIVMVFDLGESEGMAYIAMELLEGEDLRRFIEQKRPLGLDQRLELMVQVCEALAHAHRQEVVHRDIKPSNIFILREVRAKILDFGIARLPSSKLTLVGKVLGTPNYMAPEQIFGKGCDSRSDLFSAAIVFFEFVTGVHPFRGPFIPRRIADGVPESLREIDPQLPESLEAVLARALQKQPERRFQTGDEFATSLREVLTEVRGAHIPVLETAPEEPRPAEPTAPAVAAPEPPPGEDPAEWRISEFLRLLHEFDDAADRKAIKAARQVFEQMKALQAVDDRFVTAVAEYEVRLVQLEEAAPQAGEAAMPSAQQDTQTISPLSAAAAGPVIPPPPPRYEPPPARTVAPPPPPPPPARTVAPPPPPPPPPPEAPRAPETARHGPPAGWPDVPPPRYTPPPEPPKTEPPRRAPASLEATLPAGRALSPESRPRLEATQLFESFTAKPPARPADTPPPRPNPPVESPPRPALGDSIAYIPAVKPGPPPQPAGPPPQPAGPPPRPAAAKPVPEERRQTAWQRLRPEQKVIAVAVLFLVVLLAGAAYVLLFPKHVTALPAVGTAEVTSAQSAVLAEPEGSAKKLVSLKKGDKLNILRLPQFQRQEWVRVQFVSGKKVTPQGYTRSAELGNWSTVALMRAFRPDDSASPMDKTAYVAGLGRLVAQRPGTPEAREAWLEIARESLVLAQAAQAAGQPPEAWLSTAASALDSIAGDPAMKPQVDELRSQVDAMRKPPTLPPDFQGKKPPSDNRPYNPEADYRRAEQYWRMGDYDEAQRRLRRLLQRHPGYAPARALAEKIRKAQTVDPGVPR